MTAEHKIQNDIRVALSKHHCTVFRVNVGNVRTSDGRFFSAGCLQDILIFTVSGGQTSEYFTLK